MTQTPKADMRGEMPERVYLTETNWTFKRNDSPIREFIGVCDNAAPAVKKYRTEYIRADIAQRGSVDVEALKLDPNAPRQSVSRTSDAYIEGKIAGWNECIDHLSQRGLLQGGCPEGWVMVPVNPTYEMCVATNALMSEVTRGMHNSAGIYRAMLSAAPSPPKQDGEDSP